MVGTSGAALDRFTPVTPSARSRRLLRCGMAVGTAGIMTGHMSRQHVDDALARALVGHVNHLEPGHGEEELHGQVRIGSDAGRAKLICPGFVRTNTIISFTDLAGSDGCTTRTLQSVTTCEIGMKSFSASYGTLRYMAGLIARVLMPIKSV
jgi:hypothetical protein